MSLVEAKVEHVVDNFPNESKISHHWHIVESGIQLESLGILDKGKANNWRIIVGVAWRFSSVRW